ncbi:MAG: hypothetical protein EOM44_00540 [Bacteroidia bacterium]|nr:hypothetical protein [Bacteroidia bacterium]
MRKTLIYFVTLILIYGCGSDNGKEPINTAKNSFEIVLPSTVFNGEEFSVSATGKNLMKVEIYIGEKLEKTLLSEPYSVSIKLVDLNTGKNTISAIAEYKDGSKDKKSFDFQFKVKEGADYQGGLIVYLDANGLNGIIAAKDDLSDGSFTGRYFFDHNYPREGVSYKAFDENNGQNNTKLIGGTDADMAAVACRKYRGGGFSDWYIPAINEFEYMLKYDKLLKLDVSSKLYWSSTLIDGLHAKLYCFGRCAYVLKDCELNNYRYVRVLRRF